MKKLRAFAVAAAAVGVVSLTAVPAFAGSITTPTSPFTVANCTATGSPNAACGTAQFPVGKPAPFQIQATGYATGTPVTAEICDGTPSTAPGWDPTINCDSGTSPAAIPSPGTTSTVTFDPNNPNQRIGVFDGMGPSGAFNCLHQGEADPGNGLPSFTNCQLRVSSNNSAATTDQAFVTLTLSGSTPPVPEAPYAVLLPLGALLILGGGYVGLRRRNSHAPTAAA